MAKLGITTIIVSKQLPRQIIVITIDGKVIAEMSLAEWSELVACGKVALSK